MESFFGWFSWIFAICAMGIAGAAMSEIAALKQVVRVLKDELRRRGFLEQTLSEGKIIVPGSMDRTTLPETDSPVGPYR